MSRPQKEFCETGTYKTTFHSKKKRNIQNQFSTFYFVSLFVKNKQLILFLKKYLLIY